MRKRSARDTQHERPKVRELCIKYIPYADDTMLLMEKGNSSPKHAEYRQKEKNEKGSEYECKRKKIKDTMNSKETQLQ